MNVHRTGLHRCVVHSTSTLTFAHMMVMIAAISHTIHPIILLPIGWTTHFLCAPVFHKLILTVLRIRFQTTTRRIDGLAFHVNAQIALEHHMRLVVQPSAGTVRASFLLQPIVGRLEFEKDFIRLSNWLHGALSLIGGTVGMEHIPIRAKHILGTFVVLT